jgi:carbon-monoxide dehydrogenase medium subunit
MITAIRFVLPAGNFGSAWERIGRRQALVLPILNCAVSVVLDANCERFDHVRIAMGPVAPIPFRARGAEAFLEGQTASDEVIAQAASIASKESNPRSNPLRASRKYRHRSARVLLCQGLARANAQARSNL